MLTSNTNAPGVERLVGERQQRRQRARWPEGAVFYTDAMCLELQPMCSPAQSRHTSVQQQQPLTQRRQQQEKQQGVGAAAEPPCERCTPPWPGRAPQSPRRPPRCSAGWRGMRCDVASSRGRWCACDSAQTVGKSVRWGARGQVKVSQQAGTNTTRHI